MNIPEALKALSKVIRSIRGVEKTHHRYVINRIHALQKKQYELNRQFQILEKSIEYELKELKNRPARERYQKSIHRPMPESSGNSNGLQQNGSYTWQFTNKRNMEEKI